MSDEVPVIAIDGPSGVGKGTLCQWLAARLGWHLLDSGALYRLTALAAQRRGLPLEDEARVAAVAIALDAVFVADVAGSSRVLLDGVEVGDVLRGEATGNAASRVAALPTVRARCCNGNGISTVPGLIADGRDMGTVVFPQAGLKLFLNASAEERARRRYKQLIEKAWMLTLPALSRRLPNATLAMPNARWPRSSPPPMRKCWIPPD